MERKQIVAQLAEEVLTEFNCYQLDGSYVYAGPARED